MYMVDVAQLVESRIVIPVVVGSSPIIHPRSGPLAQLVEQETLNLLVESSSLSGPTNTYKGLAFCWPFVISKWRSCVIPVIECLPEPVTQ